MTTGLAEEDYPSWRPDGSQLAYASNEAGEWDIWVTQVLGGGAAVNLTTGFQGDAQFPSWSPDGSQIAFQSGRDLFLIPALGGAPQKVASSTRAFPAGPPRWSGDGKSLAYATGCPDGAGADCVEILSLEGAETLRCGLSAGERDPAGFELIGSPDGRFFAYTSAFGRASVLSEVWVIDTAGGEGHRVVGGNSFNISPSWARDGRSLFFISNRGGGMDLWRQRLSEDAEPIGPPEPVTTGLEGWYATLTHDGTKVAVAKRRAISSLWRLPISDELVEWGDAVELTLKQGQIRSVDPSPDGSDIVFQMREVDGHFIWRLPSEGGEPRRLIREPMSHYFGHWSPNGSEIAFSSEQEGNRNIRVVPATGGASRQITHTEAWSVRPRWSPNARLLLYVEGLPFDLWVVPASGGSPRRLTRDPADDLFAAWSPDSREVAFISHRTGNWEIWVLAVEDGSPRQLTQGSVQVRPPSWSPDGEWVYFDSLRSGRNQLWRIPAAGGEAAPVTAQGSIGHRFSSGGESVYFARTAEAGGVQLFQVPTSGGQERLLAELDERPGTFGGLMATDGQSLYFTWQQTFSDIWVMDIVEGVQ